MVWDIRRGFQFGCNGIKRLRTLSHFASPIDTAFSQMTNHLPLSNKPLCDFKAGGLSQRSLCRIMFTCSRHRTTARRRWEIYRAR